jgi:tetratricopeptide (TPR) repeat protein
LKSKIRNKEKMENISSLGSSIKIYTDVIKKIEAGAKDYMSLSDAYYRRGEGHYGVKNYNESILDFTKAIELDPNDGWYYAGRAEAMASIGYHAAAVADYTRGLELGTDNYTNDWMRYERGQSYARLGDHENALKDFWEVLETHVDFEYIDEYINIQYYIDVSTELLEKIE